MYGKVLSSLRSGGAYAHSDKTISLGELCFSRWSTVQENGHEQQLSKCSHLTNQPTTFACWEAAHNAFQRLDQASAEQHACGAGGEEGDLFCRKHPECCDYEKLGLVYRGRQLLMPQLTFPLSVLLQ